MYFCACVPTLSRGQSGQRERTAKAMLPRTVSQGISA
jgi:hypothetical protein